MPAVSVPIAPTGRAGLVAMLVTSASAVPLIALQQLAIGLVRAGRRPRARVLGGPDAGPHAGGGRPSAW